MHACTDRVSVARGAGAGEGIKLGIKLAQEQPAQGAHVHCVAGE